MSGFIGLSRLAKLGSAKIEGVRCLGVAKMEVLATPKHLAKTDATKCLVSFSSSSQKLYCKAL